MNSAFDPLTLGFWQTIGMAIGCALIVGFERQIRGKPAGMRTSTLICLGTTIFVYLGTVLDGGVGDPARVIGQVVTGIGFLGGGVILSREGVVVGVTTAAVIWMLAAIGSLIGLGFFSAAFVLSLLTVGVLQGVELMEKSFTALRGGVHNRRQQEEKGNGTSVEQ
mgnify:CR=1 FL=1|jgi:putative Mg2+ transporter-C (MgtC) family protein